MSRTLDPRFVCGLLFAALLLPATAAAQVYKFTKDVNDSAHAMAGCWPEGTTNFSDDGPGTYVWSLDVWRDDIVARMLSQAAAGNPASIDFSTSGTVVTQGAATGAEFDTYVSVTLNGVAVGTINGPTPGTCPSCTRVSDYQVDVTTADLTAAGVLACGTDVFIEIIVEGDAEAACTAYTNSHADAVWRGQGVYPTIKPRLTVDSSQPGC